MNKHTQNLLHATTHNSARFREFLGSRSHAMVIGQYAGFDEARAPHQWERRLDHSAVHQPSVPPALRTVRPWRDHKS